MSAMLLLSVHAGRLKMDLCATNCHLPVSRFVGWSLQAQCQCQIALSSAAADMSLALRDLYLKSCASISCEPIQAFLQDLDNSHGACLADLKLNGNSTRLFKQRVTPMQVFALCEALQNDSNLVVVDLSFNLVNDLAARAVAGLIKANKNIRFVNLAGNSIGAEGTGHLATVLSAPDCTLQVISLQGNPLGEAGVMALGDMLRVNTSLQGLDIADVNMGIKGIISVCQAMGSEGEANVNSTLQALDMSAPVVHLQQDTTALCIARMLASNTSLKELGLSKHKLVDSQLEVLVTYGLLRNTTLTSLDLRANRLSGFSGPQLERLVSERSQLTSLNLAANMLGDAGARALAATLPYSPWLTRLDLRSNSIGEQGLVALAEALGLASHLRLLLLWGNPFGPAASSALHDTLSSLQQGVVSAGGKLLTDVSTYEVDGRAQVALLQDVDVSEVVDDYLESRV